VKSSRIRTELKRIDILSIQYKRTSVNCHNTLLQGVLILSNTSETTLADFIR
jgi:hypothetical protein